MTVSEAEEKEPLLVDGNGTTRKGSYSYHSLLPNKDHAVEVTDANNHAIYLEKISSFNYSAGTDSTRSASGSGSSGSGSPNCQDIPFNLSPERITYTWSDVNVFVDKIEKVNKTTWGKNNKLQPLPQRKHILKNVSGVAYPGELLAIMGSSGAGKTTLLNTLTFRSSTNTIVNGMRAINGYPVTYNTVTSMSAYVQQDDLFIGTLTVREHLIFQALVKMDRDIPYHQRMQRVNEVISELALTKCENTTIGTPGRVQGISGGEMKRLSFASEVLTDPPLMFCDEPTSGLDSFMALNVVSVLKSMAEKGKTVICTIHQPSSEMFSMFDKILLMAEGRVAYLGKPSDACTFFKELGAECPINYNPADFFIQLLAVVPNKEDSCREGIELVCDTFERSAAGIQLTGETTLQTEFKGKLKTGWGSFELWDDNPWISSNEPERSPYKASWCAQFKAVLWRSWLSIIKEPMITKVRLMQTFMISLVVAIVYYHQELNQEGAINISGALFIFLTNMTFQNVFGVINIFCAELPIFLREHLNGMYRVDVYFLSKTLAELPVFLAIPVVFTVVVYYIIGLNPGFDHFLIAMVIITLVGNVATSFGYFISCISRGLTMALAMAPPLIIPFMLFGGFFLSSNAVPVYFSWLSYFSWFKYGYEALLINQWADIDHIECNISNSTCPKNGSNILEMYHFKKEDLLMDIVGLFGLIFVFRLLAFLALLSKTIRTEKS